MPARLGFIYPRSMPLLISDVICRLGFFSSRPPALALRIANGLEREQTSFAKRKSPLSKLQTYAIPEGTVPGGCNPVSDRARRGSDVVAGRCCRHGPWSGAGHKAGSVAGRKAFQRTFAAVRRLDRESASPGMTCVGAAFPSMARPSGRARAALPESVFRYQFFAASTSWTETAFSAASFASPVPSA